MAKSVDVGLSHHVPGCCSGAPIPPFPEQLRFWGFGVPLFRVFRGRNMTRRWSREDAASPACSGAPKARRRRCAMLASAIAGSLHLRASPVEFASRELPMAPHRDGLPIALDASNHAL
jgi:hypothetical protein